MPCRRSRTAAGPRPAWGPASRSTGGGRTSHQGTFISSSNRCQAILVRGKRCTNVALAALCDGSQWQRHLIGSNTWPGPQSAADSRQAHLQGERWCSSSTWRHTCASQSTSPLHLRRTTWLPLTLYSTTWCETSLGWRLGRQVPPGWSRHRPGCHVFLTIVYSS